jgi:hypothetical protein
MCSFQDAVANFPMGKSTNTPEVTDYGNAMFGKIKGVWQFFVKSNNGQILNLYPA